MADEDKDEQPEDDSSEQPVEEEPGAEDGAADDSSSTEEEAGIDEQEDVSDVGDRQETDGGLLSRIRAFDAGDWMVIVLGILLVGVAVVSYVPLDTLVPGSGSAAGSEVVQYCERTATAVEEESELPEGTTCDCVPPGTFDESRFSVAEKVDNATELFLVQCTLPNDQDIVFPIRRVVNESINASEELPNTSMVN